MAESKETVQTFAEMHETLQAAIGQGAIDSIMNNADIGQVVALYNIIFAKKYIIGRNDNDELMILNKLE